MDFLAENLRDDDFSVLSASTGVEAIDVLGRSRPDVILLDVVLPDTSGYEICRTVRQGDGINDPWDPDLAIIMLSAKAEHTDRVRGLVRGADDYVTKPHSLPWMIPSRAENDCHDRESEILALDDVVNLEDLWLARKLDSNIRQNRHQDFAVRLELLLGIPDFTDA